MSYQYVRSESQGLQSNRLLYIPMYPSRYFFSQRVIPNWNNLPSHVSEAKTVNQFKNRFDNHLKLSGYGIPYSKSFNQRHKPVITFPIKPKCKCLV